VTVTWKPGTVLSHYGREKIKEGQHWTYFQGTDPTAMMRDSRSQTPPHNLQLTVVSTSPEGEVVLRPEDPQVADQLFPDVEGTFKGAPIRTRKGCPFKWVNADIARASKGRYQVGDLLTHEAWACWADMHLHQSSA
jgi:hypothetical protein